MVIKASASAEIRLLVEALAAGDGLRRDAAAARLRVIGPRAVERLLAALARAASTQARLTILRVLEPLGDPRSLAPARLALKDADSEVAGAAAQVLGRLLDGGDASVATAALEALVSAAVDATVPRPVRLAAFEMLRDLPDEVRAEVAEVLRPEADPAQEPVESALQAARSMWSAALEGRLPERAADLRDALHTRAGTAPLAALQRLVDTVRAREAAGGDRAPEWQALRGSLHQALAARGSRVALYDLRESLAGAVAPLPVSFLSAVHTLGDRSCLEPLAQAYGQAGTDEGWWRQQVVAAFETILSREKLTRRSAVVRKILVRWPVGQPGV